MPASDPLHKHGRFFDVWSNWYRYTPLGMALRHLQSTAIELLAVAPGERVLDLGCGPGDGMRQIQERGGVAFGLDYSQGMLDKASRNTGLRQRLSRGDAGRLPFRSGSLDKVICTNSFHHYPDRPASLREIRRALKPGGKLVLIDPRRDNLVGRILIDGFERRVFGLEEVGIYSIEEWKALLGDAGFAACDVRRGPLWNLPAWTEAFIEATA